MINILHIFRHRHILNLKAIYIVNPFVCLLYVTGMHAQQMPKKPTPQQFAGYHVRQQQNWQQKQLPVNSITYQFGTTPNTSSFYNFNLKKEKPVASVILSVTNNLLLNTNRTVPSPALNLYLMEDRQQMIRDQKQGWWKDPAQAPGAELFRSMFMNNKSNWLYNSTSILKNN